MAGRAKAGTPRAVAEKRRASDRIEAALQVGAGRIFGIDGIERTQAEDRRISLDVLSTFRSPAGMKALSYLKGITINNICGGSVSDAELRHREGSRWLVAVIEQRMMQAEQMLAAGTPVMSPRTEDHRPGDPYDDEPEEPEYPEQNYDDEDT